MLKYTTSYIAEYFKQHNCKLLDEYCGCQSKMKYRCSCGEIGFTSWNNFTKGKRCGHCAKCGHSKKRSLEQVEQIFLERGCEFLDDEFKGIHYKHRYRCQCGREAKITFGGFHHQNQLCKECGSQKNTGSGNHGWIKDRKQKRLNDLFRKRCYKALASSLKAVGKLKVGCTSDMLGYSPKELQEHVKQHPNWPKVKNGDWHLDHIFPIQAFQDYVIDDVSLINCLDNLRPISQQENNQKRDKYSRKEFEEWINLRSV